MKRILSVCMILLALLCAALPAAVLAASGSATLTGPATVRAGDTITLTFSLSGKNMEGVSGKLQYNSAQLTKVEQKQTIASPWLVEFNGDNMIAYDNELSAPINSEKGLFTVRFRVGNVAPGTQITVSYVDVVASDGDSDANIGTVTYRVTVAPPLSGDNNLSSLTVSNATISPAFQPGTTSYTAEVPYDVAKLEVKATAADGGAKVRIDSPALTPDGYTNVTVTVTAENGAKKTYTIRVHRAQDPNYVPSGDNALAGLQVEGFLLSPAFDPALTEYVVWLPYETERVTVSGKAADAKADVKVVGGDALEPGKDNPVQVICTAEDGSQKVYTVVVKRAAAHGETPVATEPPTEPATEPPTEPAPTTEPTPTEPAPTQTESPSTEASAPTQAAQETAGSGLARWWWLFVLVGAGGLGLGFAGGYWGKKKKA